MPCFFLMLGLPFLPESPRWLAKVDRSEEAIQTLADIQAEGNVDDPTVVAEWEDITTTLAAERSALPGWRKFVYNSMWKRTVAGFCVQMWQQNSGANVMTYVSCLFVVPWILLRLTRSVCCIHLWNGWSVKQRQSDLQRCSICDLHCRYRHHVLLRRQGWQKTTVDLWRHCYGCMPFCCRRCTQHWHLCSRWRRWQSKHQDPGWRFSRKHGHCLLLSAHSYLQYEFSASVLDIRGRGVVIGDESNWHGNCGHRQLGKCVLNGQ